MPSAHAFIDTAVLTDLLENYEPSIEWQKSRGAIIFAICPTIWMEVMSQATSLSAQQSAGKFLTQFEMIYPTEDDMKWAMRQLVSLRVIHGVTERDCMIASVCHRLQLPLYTRDLRALTPLIPDLIRQPY